MARSRAARRPWDHSVRLGVTVLGLATLLLLGAAAARHTRTRSGAGTAIAVAQTATSGGEAGSAGGAGSALGPEALPGERRFRRFLPHAMLERRAARLGAARLEPPPTNVLLFIGDGMGAGHVQAAGIARHGRPGSLVFERFPHRAWMSTANRIGEVTDSAAAATAMATCIKVDNGLISADPLRGSARLTTVLEVFGMLGKRRGLVTTAELTDATPAAFGAHAASRYDLARIGEGLLRESRPELLLGGASAGLDAERAAAAGYRVLGDRAALLALGAGDGEPIAGLFGQGHLPAVEDAGPERPSLAEMTRAAIRSLETDPEGFFLLVEEEGTDTFAHANDLPRTIGATLALADAVQVALDWAGRRDDTLIIVTSDHETGGLAIDPKALPDLQAAARFTSSQHSAAAVPVYAVGRRAEAIAGRIDNTALPGVMLPAGHMEACGP